MRLIERVLNEERNVSLTGYLLQTEGEFTGIEKRPAVIVIPGGGYQMCSDREADPVAMAYLQAGYHTFILRYSVQEHAKWPNPLEDYEAAMTCIRAEADNWKILEDKIAVIGFSAGGHLASAAATMAKNRPNAAILGYAVLNKNSIAVWEPSAPDTVSAVDKNTCPCFLFASRSDTTVPVKSTMEFAAELEKSGITFELHIYAYGSHGFSLGTDAVGASNVCSRTKEWVVDSISWLSDVFGDFSAHGMTQPRCGHYVNGNFEEWCSVDCTLGKLLQNEASAQIVRGILSKASSHQGASENAGNDSMYAMAQGMTLRELLGYGNVPAEVLEGINMKLKQIRN